MTELDHEYKHAEEHAQDASDYESASLEQLGQYALASFQSLLQFNIVRELANEAQLSAPVTFRCLVECNSPAASVVSTKCLQSHENRQASSPLPISGGKRALQRKEKHCVKKVPRATAAAATTTTTTTTRISHSLTTTTATDPLTMDEHLVSWEYILQMQEINPDMIQLTKKNGGMRVNKKQQNELRLQAQEYFQTDGTLFNIIYADPPWQYRNREGLEGLACAEYSTMSNKDICAMPVGGLAADDCYLLMWATGPKMLEAFEVMRAWGFRYVCIFFNWVKISKKGTPRVCMANYTLPASEFCLLGARGKTQWMKNSKTIQQVMFEPVTVHSRKPDESYRRIHQFFRPELPRIELFARRNLPTWTSWGNQLATEVVYPEGLRDIFPQEDA